MSLLVASFIAGILTILAPCVLPVIPTIIGGSISSRYKQTQRTILIITSLGLAIFVFTLALKASTSLLGVPQIVWQLISGILIIAIGLAYVFPVIWDRIMLATGTALRSQQFFATSNSRSGATSAVLTGIALGPVFTSCSPTYLFIVAAILPVDFFIGTGYLVAYIVGLCVSLFGLAVVGTKIVRRLKWSLNPEGWFRRSVGLLMVLVGLLVIFGGDKAIQSQVLESGLYAPIESIENSLR